MNLYKANFTTVIHCEDEYDAVKIARNLCDEETFVTYEEESIKEILTEDDLPCGWEMSFHPVINGDGSYDTHKIRDIFHAQSDALVLRNRIKELEEELKELKAQL